MAALPSKKRRYQKAMIDLLIKAFSLDGVEIYMSSIIPREKTLYKNNKEKEALLKFLKAFTVKRVHMSYWAELVDFIGDGDQKSLHKRFRTKKNIMKYYSDFTGEHIYNRWLQEYSVAKSIGAEVVTFHLIEYYHVDGQWQFRTSKKAILKALTRILSKLLVLLEESQLLKDGPIIELENAGFGLESGAQTAQDFAYVFKHLHDIHEKVKIAWDTNHLLHAVGIEPKNSRGIFLLPLQEITYEMKLLQLKYGDHYDLFCVKWIEKNILYPQLLTKVRSIHLSNSPVKTERFFMNGKLSKNYYSRQMSLTTMEEKEAYGANIVLEHYDAHVPFEKGSKILKASLVRITESIQEVSIIHEFKKTSLDKKSLSKQLSYFRE